MTSEPQEKLIETRGEEPPFLPGHVGESWQKVEFGLGASSLQAHPQAQEALPPRQRHWGRMLAYAAAGLLLTLLAVAFLRTLLAPHGI